MQRHGIPGLLVDALDDVDLTTLGPVRAQKPERWPHAANILGHVGDVGNEETMVVGLLGRQAYAGTAQGGCHDRVVDAKVDGPGGFCALVHKAFGDCRSVVNVLDEASGWVSRSEVCEFGVEVGGGELFAQAVVCRDRVG